MRQDDGQVSLIAAMVIAFGVVAVSGLEKVERLILTSSIERSAGEAAVEAATAVVADAYAAEIRARAQPSRSPRAMRTVVTARDVVEFARATADDISTRNDGPSLDRFVVICDGPSLNVTAWIRDVRFSAGFASDECSRP